MSIFSRMVRRLTLFVLLAAGMNLFLSAASIQPISEVGAGIGAPVGGGGDSLSPIVSANGRYVLFASSANNLALNSNNTPMFMSSPPKMNVYLRDRSNGTTTLVSVNLTGNGGGNGDSFPVDISTNGQFVLFEGSASNLNAGATSNYNNVYVRDLINGTNLLVSAKTNGVAGNAVSRSSAMTPDGRFVTFVSSASDLVAGDNNGIADVFVRDLQMGVTRRVSLSAQRLGTSSELPDITPDGRYVAFYSTATNIVPGVTNSGEVYVADLLGGTTSRVSAYAHNVTTNSLSLNHVISDDGQFIAYEAINSANSANSGTILRFSQSTGLTDIVATNAVGIIAGSELNRRVLDMTPDGRFIAYVANVGSVTAIYQWDAQSNTNTLVSGTYASNTVPAISICDWPVMDSTGRYVTFLAGALGLTTNGDAGFHIYQRDMQSGVTRLVDANTNGVASGTFSFPRLSADGSVVAFESQDSLLVPHDSNRAYDVFAANLSANTMEMISVASPLFPSLTPNGFNILSTSSVSTNTRYIAFLSEANNLVPNETNGFRNLILRDLLLGTNILANPDTNGLPPNNGVASDLALSGNGRYVAFGSTSSNLVANDTNGSQDVFLRDLQLGSTALVSVATNGGFGNAASSLPTISADGRYVLFHSSANNLASGVLNSTVYDNVYWRDLQAGLTRVLTTNNVINSGLAFATITAGGRYVAVRAPNTTPFYIWDMVQNKLVYTNSTVSSSATVLLALSSNANRIGFMSRTTTGSVYAVDRGSNTTVTLGNAPSGSHERFQFSGDSRFLVYVGADSAKTNQIYLYDFQTGTNILISQSTNGISGNGHSDSPDLSSDGRFIAYRSVANNLGAGIFNGVPNVYLYDRVANTTLLLSGSTSPTWRSLTPVFSGDSQTLVFESWDPAMGGQDGNQWSDIFTLGLYGTNAQPAFNAVLSSPINGQSPVITWTTTPGKNYQVQFKNHLSDPVWQVLNGNVTINGNQESMADPNPANQRFYRIVSY